MKITSSGKSKEVWFGLQESFFPQYSQEQDSWFKLPQDFFNWLVMIGYTFPMKYIFFTEYLSSDVYQ